MDGRKASPAGQWAHWVGVRVRVRVRVRVMVRVRVNAPLEEDGEALVHPEVLPRAIGDEVAAPRVGDLVRHHVGLAAVAGDERRRHERQTRVLHPACTVHMTDMLVLV